MVSDVLKDMMLDKLTENKSKKKKKKKVKKSKVHKDITQFLAGGYSDDVVSSDDVSTPVTEVKKVRVLNNKTKNKMDMEQIEIPIPTRVCDKDHKEFTKDKYTIDSSDYDEEEEIEPNDITREEIEEDEDVIEEDMINIDDLSPEEYIDYMINQKAPDEYLQHMEDVADFENASELDPDQEEEILKLVRGNAAADNAADDMRNNAIAKQDLQTTTEIEPETLDTYNDIPEIDVSDLASKLSNLSFEETPDDESNPEDYGYEIEPDVEPDVEVTVTTTAPTITNKAAQEEIISKTAEFSKSITDTLANKSVEEIANPEFADINSIPEVDMGSISSEADAILNRYKGLGD